MGYTERQQPAWRSYSVYGLTLSTDYPLIAPLPLSPDEPDITFTCRTEDPPTEHAETLRPLRHSADHLPSGEPWVSLYRADGYDIVHFAEVVDFHLYPHRIVAYLLDPAYSHQVEIYLLGGVLALWCELSGTPMLHASAVVVHDRAAVFVATNEGGKSSLAIALMQLGHPLLTDDILRIRPEANRYWGEPGIPELRLWPHDAERLFGDYEQLDLAHPAYTKRRVPIGKGFGAFCSEPRPLGCLYLPRRRQPGEDGMEVEIADLPPRQAVIELIRGSFVPRWVEAAGLQRHQLELLSRLVTRVPVRTLSYPHGVERLGLVREKILTDLRRGPHRENG